MWQTSMDLTWLVGHKKPSERQQNQRIRARIAARQNSRFGQSLLHVALVGQVSSGKSSMVNALRMIPDSDPNAATVSALQTHLDAPVGYVHSIEKSLKIWDVRGYDRPCSEYYQQQGLNRFDILLVFLKQEITEYDIELCREAQADGVVVWWVQSKMDEHIRQDLRTHAGQRTAASFDRVRESFETSFRFKLDHSFPQRTDNPRVFFVSARRFLDPNTYVSIGDGSGPGEMDEDKLLSALHAKLEQRMLPLVGMQVPPAPTRLKSRTTSSVDEGATSETDTPATPRQVTPRHVSVLPSLMY